MQKLADITQIIASELRPLGFLKSKSIYLCPLGEDASGWLGLNAATHRSDGRIGINPVVGVRHERIENMIEGLLGEKESRLAPTISTPLGYLMPEGQYLEWLFEPPPFDNASECEKIVKAVETYGVPFMKSNAALEDIIRDLEQLRFASRDTALYRSPIAYLLAGKTELAVAHVKKQLEEVEERNDLAAQQYKIFASNLLEDINRPS